MRGNTEIAQIFNGIEILKDLSGREFFMFFVYLSLIFILKLAIELTVKRIIKQSSVKKRFIPIF